ncbi:zinc finger protein 449-like [Castor canadensis]|uniref:Zinc finger protein 449-like n=1 Tax=Castor canadensis TaxID=51338 RepID=A0AC58LQX5_CASCN
MDSPADYSLLAPFLCKGDPVLHRDDADSEASRQRFRQFQYIAEAGPREVFRKLSELCSQWLKPRMRSVEQILELLVLEQFLTILPTHLEARVSTYCPENKERLFSLIEDLQRVHERPEYQIDIDDTLFEELPPVQTELMPPHRHSRSPALQLRGSAQEALGAEAWIPQSGQQELNYHAAGKCKPFLDPGPEMLEPDWSFLLEHGGEELLGSKREYEQLEPICKEPPDELLDSCMKPGSHLGESSNWEESLNLRVLMPKVPREKSYHCGQCEKCFPYRYQLAVHLKTHSGELGYKCSVCGKRFLLRSELYRHQLIHKGEKPYECAECKKQFTHGAHLAMHQKRHSEKMYQCVHCRRKFLHKSSLMEHMKTHTREQSYGCYCCEKSFSSWTALILHQKTHTEEKPFACDHCEKRYRQRSSLMVHVRIHTGEKPYKCSHCSKSFRKKSGLIAHQAAHFREEFPEHVEVPGFCTE